MSIVNKLKTDSLTARKNRETVKAGFLVTLLSEVQNVGKSNGNRETTDVEAIAVIKKFCNNSKMVLEAAKNKVAAGDMTGEADGIRADMEIKIAESYLPKQLTAEDIHAILGEMPVTDMKTVQGHFKENYAGRYDGKLLAQIVNGVS